MTIAIEDPGTHLPLHEHGIHLLSNPIPKQARLFDPVGDVLLNFTLTIFVGPF